MSNEIRPAILSNGKIEYLSDSRLYLATSLYHSEPAEFQVLTDALDWLNKLEFAAKKKPNALVAYLLDPDL